MKKHQWFEFLNTGASKVLRCKQCNTQIGVGLDDTPENISDARYMSNIIDEDCDEKIITEIMQK